MLNHGGREASDLEHGEASRGDRDGSEVGTRGEYKRDVGKERGSSKTREEEVESGAKEGGRRVQMRKAKWILSVDAARCPSTAETGVGWVVESERGEIWRAGMAVKQLSTMVEMAYPTRDSHLSDSSSVVEAYRNPGSCDAPMLPRPFSTRTALLKKKLLPRQTPNRTKSPRHLSPVLSLLSLLRRNRALSFSFLSHLL